MSSYIYLQKKKLSARRNQTRDRQCRGFASHVTFNYRTIFHRATGVILPFAADTRNSITKTRLSFVVGCLNVAATAARERLFAKVSQSAKQLVEKQFTKWKSQWITYEAAFIPRLDNTVQWHTARYSMHHCERIKTLSLVQRACSSRAFRSFGPHADANVFADSGVFTSEILSRLEFISHWNARVWVPSSILRDYRKI